MREDCPSGRNHDARRSLAKSERNIKTLARGNDEASCALGRGRAVRVKQQGTRCGCERAGAKRCLDGAVGVGGGLRAERGWVVAWRWGKNALSTRGCRPSFAIPPAERCSALWPQTLYISTQQAVRLLLCATLYCGAKIFPARRQHAARPYRGGGASLRVATASAYDS